jgi:hypothetical protein
LIHSRMTEAETGRDTTRFHSFTDENISSVCDSEFVGNFVTDDIPDRKCPLTFLSSVIPNSVAKSVSKKNNRQWFYRQKLHAKKKFPIWHIPTDLFRRW